LNRIDDIVVFHRLGKPELSQVVEIQLGKFRALLAERQLELKLAPEARALIVERGYDPAYGARPLKRAIQRYLVDPLAREVIAGRFAPGDRIVATRHGDELRFEKGARSSGKEAA
jgi:ATP-dependent Clp protease ATP-binding subunit ClpB